VSVIFGRHYQRVLIFTGQLHLHKQIDCTPNRVQETGEVEDRNKKLSKIVAAMNRLIDL